MEKDRTMAVLEFSGYNVEDVQKFMSAAMDFLSDGNCKVSVVTEAGRKKIHEVLKK